MATVSQDYPPGPPDIKSLHGSPAAAAAAPAVSFLHDLVAPHDRSQELCWVVAVYFSRHRNFAFYTSDYSVMKTAVTRRKRKKGGEELQQFKYVGEH